MLIGNKLDLVLQLKKNEIHGIKSKQYNTNKTITVKISKII